MTERTMMCGPCMDITPHHYAGDMWRCMRCDIATLKVLTSGLRAISTAVGVERTWHLTSCIRYGGRGFDPHETCTAECAAVRPALDALSSLP